MCIYKPADRQNMKDNSFIRDLFEFATIVVGVFAVVTIVCAPLMWFAAYHEAKAYERKKVSTWDAFCLELRVTP
jgi:hypothetical protein